MFAKLVLFLGLSIYASAFSARSHDIRTMNLESCKKEAGEASASGAIIGAIAGGAAAAPESAGMLTEAGVLIGGWIGGVAGFAGGEIVCHL